MKIKWNFDALVVRLKRESFSLRSQPSLDQFSPVVNLLPGCFSFPRLFHFPRHFLFIFAVNHFERVSDPHVDDTSKKTFPRNGVKLNGTNFPHNHKQSPGIFPVFLALLRRVTNDFKIFKSF